MKSAIDDLSLNLFYSRLENDVKCLQAEGSEESEVPW